MIKTKLEILEKMHNDTTETLLYKQIEADLIQGRILMIITDDAAANERRAVYNEALADAKTKIKGHETMLARIDKIIEEEKKHATIPINPK